MKKALTAILLALVLVAPAVAPAAVEAGAGNITLLGHIDFVGRYSAEEDHGQAWGGYETYNTEFAVLGVAGQVGDNVDWVITHAFAFAGPYASVNSAVGAPNNDNMGQLLDARINVHLGDMLVISAGRFIPPTSMTWNPHLLGLLQTINYPLINGSGVSSLRPSGGGMMLPLPMYQTGVMLTANMGPLCLQVGNFNGMGITNANTALLWAGPSNTMDIDKTKATVAKLSLNSEGFHLGGWYNGETAWIDMGAQTHDAQLAQWGAELAYTSDAFLLQAQYLSTTLDLLDDNINDDLIQNGWYVLAGVGVGPAMLVGRYDMVNYDVEELILDEDRNEESAMTAGVNFKLNDATTAGVNYTWRDVEDWAHEGDELAFILEVNLF